MKTINSGIFGETVLLSEDEEESLTVEKLILTYHVNALGLLFKELNRRGFIATIQVMGDSMQTEETCCDK